MNRWLFLTLSLVLSLPSSLWAWGSVGHKTIAFIAQDRLTPQARQAVRRILGSDKSLASVSTWADVVAHSVRPETGPWHYIQVNVRQDENVYDLSGLCKNHDCVVDQIERDETVLKDPNAKLSAKREALCFLVHFVGDIHQPLHCAEDNDRGGNEKWFRYYPAGNGVGRYTWVNLHGFWDDLLELHAKEKPGKFARQLESDITEQQAADWQKGTAKDWAFESYKIARDAIYSGLKPGPIQKSFRWGQDLPSDYYGDTMRRVVERRLEAAGVRLAWVLNQIFTDKT